MTAIPRSRASRNESRGSFSSVKEQKKVTAHLPERLAKEEFGKVAVSEFAAAQSASKPAEQSRTVGP